MIVVKRCRLPSALLSIALTAGVAGAAALGRGMPSPKGAAAGARVVLRPKFAVGQVMRYRIELQSTSETKRTGVVEDPEGPARLVVTWDAIVRLEVLAAPSGAPPSAASATAFRLRTTYEKSAATVESDTPDPQAENTEKQYAQLEARSFEFTMSADGHVSDVHGLEEIVPDDAARTAAQQWMSQVSAATSAPARGIAPGETWNTEEPANALPLAGLVWRTGSTYLRNEPCRPADPSADPSAGNASGAAAAPAQAGEMCAVILARLDLAAPHALKDQTPEAYRRGDLHSAGKWTGEGDSLTYVSLQTGWVVSVTQNASEQMDVTIAHKTGGALRYAGTVTTRSQLALLPPGN